jgi:hypothetical protein
MTVTRFVPVSDRVELVEALREGVGADDGWLQATGFLEDVELRLAGEGIDPRRTLRGRWMLVSLSGPAAGPLGVVLARAAGAGNEVVAGQLLSGRASGVTAWLQAVGPVASVGVVPEEVTTPAAPSLQRSAPAANVATAPGGWAALAQAAAEASRVDEPEPEDDAWPERGDRVQHFVFGLCDVLMVTGDRYKIRDVHGSGRVREIAIEHFDVRRLPDREGKRVFKLAKRG